MKRTHVKLLLEKIAALKVLVIGDLMLDEYLWGSVERISPEAPVQVLDLKRSDVRLGGAGNVVNNLIALGCRVSVASVIGDDENAVLLKKRLEVRGLSDEGIVTQPGRITSRKTRVLASNQQIVRIDHESREAISAEAEQRLLDYLSMQTGESDLVLVSDYLKGVLSERVLQEVIQSARKQGVPVIIDPKGSEFGKYRGATLLTPNRKELQVVAGLERADDASLRDAGFTLLKDLELDALALTRSEEGISLFFPDGREERLPAEAREVFDVTGAGDTVLTVLGTAFTAGAPLEQAAWLANVAAGLVVAKVGASTADAEEILAALSHSHFDSELKITSCVGVDEALAPHRGAGKKIVFTNGCFDLLHVGHVKYLQKARQLGDLLVLGLNSDASIRRLKGAKRPLIGEEERAHILAALDCIDYVVVFNEDTPLQLIEIVKPDILVKGGDYSPKEVVGREFVESCGGRVELIQFVDGKSTTNIIEKVLQQYSDEQ
ncbi:MAG: bifunctional heptose 7-phosphate kinase/heptose 1-phosphate adenyltransferase [Desulfuromonas sp.]|nr:MAG: bifunctional heptose 7-phosphate kinase/heptose 1-phosphate adenyltransferase [Desulfuromonas sp.]